MKRLIIVYIGILVILSCSACQLAHKKENDRLLAKVHNRTLYLSELDGMFPLGTTGEDSALIINAFVERWIRETLLLYEAERNIPSDLNIDKLVRDYRASLIRHNYEQVLVNELLDSVVTPEVLVEFYEKHIERYQLESPIIRCYFVKIPLSVAGIERFKSNWSNSANAESKAELINFCNQYAQTHLLEDSVWYRGVDILADLPEGTLSLDNISKREIVESDDDYHYFLKILDLKKKNEIAPLSFVEEEIRKTILRDRKLKLLEDKKNEMYELELRRNNIQIYTQ